MGIMAIAKIKDKFDITVGFRLFDKETNKVVDADIKSIVDKLVSSNIKIEGIALEDCSIVGNGVAYSKLPDIENGYYRGDINIYQVVYELLGIGYRLVDQSGRTRDVSTREGVAIARNAKVINANISGKSLTKKLGDFEIIRPTDELVKEIKDREEHLDRINSKIRLLNYPYIIQPDYTIKVIDDNANEFRIVEPVKYIRKLPPAEIVKIPGSVKEIDREAFWRCNMRELYLEEGIEKIHYLALANKSLITELKLPSTLKLLGENAFSACYSLKRIEIPEGVEYIGSYLFNSCENLEEVIIKAKIKELPEGMFNECKNLRKVVLPDTIEKLDNKVFSGCKQLRRFNIPKGIKEISKNVLRNKSLDDSFKKMLKATGKVV